MVRVVRELGEPVVDDPARLAAVRGIGVGETAFLLATAVSTTRFVTGIVEVTRGRPARLLDVVDGRSGPALAGWLSARDPGWKRQVGFAALDPFRGYTNALRTELGEATRMLDAFPTVRLGFAVVDEVRRRVQQQTLSRRGQRDDPLYRIRRMLRCGAEHLTDTGWRRLRAGLDLGDPHRQLAVAWAIAQQLRRLYSADRLPDRRRTARPAATRDDQPPRSRGRPARPDPDQLAAEILAS